MSDILDKPFGPYLDRDVLTEKCKSIPSRTLKLNDLLLECGGEPIGLTECEPCQGAQYDRSRVERHPAIRFRGVLEIEILPWLTPWGQKTIEVELQKRDVALRSGRSGRSNLTLQNVYLRHKSIKILVQGTKNMAALYLRSKDVEDGLLLPTQDRYRKYEVQTMDVRVYDRSRLFLSRYRALKIIDDLLALDAKTQARQNSSTPLASRTPQWLVSIYKRYMATSDLSTRRRLVYDSSDSDIAPDSGGMLREGRRRTPRHIASAEILSLFAMHSEWLYLDMHKRREQRLNEQAWVRWVHEVRMARRISAAEGIKWGIWSEDELFAMEEDLPEPRVPPEKQNRKRRRGSPSPEIPSLPAIPSSLRPVSARLTRSIALQHSASENARTYDPDFSPESTPPASPTSSDVSLPARPPTPPNPEILRLFPPAFFHPPRIPLSFRWLCPWETCDYAIDLLKLTLDNCRMLEEDQVRRLGAGGWRLSDPWVQECFSQMVHAHFLEHVDQAGVRMWQEKGRWKFAWKRPAVHAPWPPDRAPKATIKIKVEEGQEEEEEFTTSSDEE